MFAFLLSNKLTLKIAFRVKKLIISNAKLTIVAQRTDGAQSQRVVFSSFKIVQSYPPILAPKRTECVGIYKNVSYRKYLKHWKG